jgi:hypothetical protein
VLSALFAIALHRASVLARAADARGGLRAFVALVGAAQLAMLLYDPRAVVPSGEDEEAGRRLVAALRDAPGDVFAPADSYLATLAGKRPYLHQMAANDILRGIDGPIPRKLINDVHNGFHDRRWAMVITDDDWFADDVVTNYRRTAQSVPDPNAFYPVAGARFRPGWIFRPKP